MIYFYNDYATGTFIAMFKIAKVAVFFKVTDKWSDGSLGSHSSNVIQLKDRY